MARAGAAASSRAASSATAVPIPSPCRARRDRDRVVVATSARASWRLPARVATMLVTRIVRPHCGARRRRSACGRRSRPELVDEIGARCGVGRAGRPRAGGGQPVVGARVVDAEGDVALPGAAGQRGERGERHDQRGRPPAAAVAWGRACREGATRVIVASDWDIAGWSAGSSSESAPVLDGHPDDGRPAQEASPAPVISSRVQTPPAAGQPWQGRRADGAHGVHVDALHQALGVDVGVGGACRERSSSRTASTALSAVDLGPAADHDLAAALRRRRSRG